MRVAVDNLNERFGAIFLPLLERLANFITNTVVPKLDAFIEGFNKLDAGTKQNILIFGVFVAAIGPLLLGIGLLMKAVRLLSAAFVALHSRIFFIPLAIAALIGAIALQVDGMDKGAQAADGFAIRILVAVELLEKASAGRFTRQSLRRPLGSWRRQESTPFSASSENGSARLIEASSSSAVGTSLRFLKGAFSLESLS